MDLIRVGLDQVGDAQIPLLYPDLVRVRRRVVAVAVGHRRRVVWAPQNGLAKLNALGDEYSDTIYPGDKIVVADDRATCHPRANDRRIVDVKFGNSTNDGTLGRQI